jgi:hypothetical protein
MEQVYHLGHLLEEGTLDTLVEVALPFQAAVRRVVVDRQHRLLWAPVRQPGVEAGAPLLVRVLPDGSVDSEFRLELQPDVPFTAGVRDLALQSDGRILISVPNSGFIPDIEAAPRTLIRLLTDGSQDPEFEFIPLGSVIHSVIVTPEQQIIIAGSFWEFSGPRVRGLARINAYDERRLYDARIIGSNFEATLRTRPGRRYVIEASAQVSDGPWDPIGSVTGNGFAVEIHDGHGDQCFYRVRVQD